MGGSDGPASFNAILTADGHSGSIISVDPLYVFSAEYRTTIQRTAYEFQEGGNEMLIIFSPAAAAR